MTRRMLAIVAVLGLTAPALAQGDKFYGQFGSWKVSGHSDSCFATGLVDGDLIVLGQMPPRDIGGFSVISDKLASHVGKQKSNMSISFDGDVPEPLNARIVAADGPLEPSMMASYPMDIFAAQIAKPVEITLSVDGKQAWRGMIVLNDDAQAALAKCKSELPAK